LNTTPIYFKCIKYGQRCYRKFKWFKGIKFDNSAFFLELLFQILHPIFSFIFHGFALFNQMLGLYHFVPHPLHFIILSRQVIQHCNLRSWKCFVK